MIITKGVSLLRVSRPVVIGITQVTRGLLVVMVTIRHLIRTRILRRAVGYVTELTSGRLDLYPFFDCKEKYTT